MAVRDRGQGRLEGPGLAGEHQRRLPGQLVEDPVERGRLRPVGLLGGRERPPGAWRPGLGGVRTVGFIGTSSQKDALVRMSSEVVEPAPLPGRLDRPPVVARAPRRPPGPGAGRRGPRGRRGRSRCGRPRRGRRPRPARRPGPGDGPRRGRRARRHGRPGPRSPASGPAGAARRAGRPSPAPGRSRPGWPGRRAAGPAPGAHPAGSTSPVSSSQSAIPSPSRGPWMRGGALAHH